ncbi:hypothetical protein C2I36_00490 [Rhodobacteraceae bacterium WD3A24]|nr:hypothetical protein C2I36_00490 [Rhodobacteraceae bacterium WD3A24]
MLFERRSDQALFCLTYHHEPGYDGRHRALAFLACDSAGSPVGEALEIPARACLAGLPPWLRLPDDARDEEVIASCLPYGRIRRSELADYAAFLITPVGGAPENACARLDHILARPENATSWRVYGQAWAGAAQALHDCPSGEEAIRYLKDALPIARLSWRDFVYLKRDAHAFTGDFYTVATRVLSDP